MKVALRVLILFFCATAISDDICFELPAALGWDLPVGVSYVQGSGATPSRVTVRLEDGSYVIADLIAPGTLHFATSASATPPKAGQPIFRTPMHVAPNGTNAPSLTRGPTGTYTAADVGLKVQRGSLGVEIVDGSGKVVARIRPIDQKSPWKGLEIVSDANHVYGLGEYPRGNGTDTPWIGQVAGTDGEHGNIMSLFFGGVQTYTQFPVAYGLRPNGEAFAVFVDTPYKIQWDFREKGKWKMHTWGDEVRFTVLTGKDLPEVHKKYLDLTGRPPVPPKSLFSPGVSKFGYKSWGELDRDLAEMEKHGVPVGMVALDLYWFGGTFIHDTSGPRKHTRMGALTPDEKNFPNFAEKIAQLKKKGIEVMLISESYVNSNLKEADRLLELGCVVKDGAGKPILFENQWWGSGYMIDWTNPASKTWIKEKYLPLAKMGVRHFWFDLGEPEKGQYAPHGRYFGIEPGKHNHGDIHNIYNLMWVQRFKEVMDKEMPDERFYVMNRSGTSGIHRHGAGKWGGDTGMTVLNPNEHPNFGAGDIPELIAHLQNRIMNLPWVGVDYYTSDVGGFHRWNIGGDKEKRDKGYTVWYANGAMLDMPFRPHLWENPDKPGYTGYLPTHVGHVPSNTANARQRAELEPYYYQAAHAASSTGRPVVTPLVYNHSNDPAVRQMGHQAYIGKDLMVAIVGNTYETRRNVYLPQGGWYDFHTGEYHAATNGGRWLPNVPVERKGNLMLPTFVREGAIIPLDRLEGDGRRVGADKELRFRVYGSNKKTTEKIIEDDGGTKGYLNGQTRTTKVTQEKTEKGYKVTVEGSEGTYSGAPTSRAQRVEVVVPSGTVGQVFVDGKPATEVQSEADLKGNKPVYHFDPKTNMATIHAPDAPTITGRVFEVNS